jgi:uncharacterized membrane protein YcaP (DUF421 family)
MDIPHSLLSSMFFDSWYGLLRVLIAGSVSYASLVVVLRCFGKRTLTKMNAFDLVVTVALGSTLATVVLSKDVAILEGILAFLLLASLQFLVSWLSVRFPKFEQLVKSEPTLLIYQGEYLRGNMRRARITEAEMLSALRTSGLTSTDAEAVVLETDGRFSVIANAPGKGSSSTLDSMVRS